MIIIIINFALYHLQNQEVKTHTTKKINYATNRLIEHCKEFDYTIDKGNLLAQLYC